MLAMVYKFNWFKLKKVRDLCYVLIVFDCYYDGFGIVSKYNGKQFFFLFINWWYFRFDNRLSLVLAVKLETQIECIKKDELAEVM